MNKVMKYYVRLFMMVMPILMLPMVTDPFGFGKNWLVMAMAVVGMVLWVVEMLLEKKSEIKTNKVLGVLALLTVWAWLDWWFRMGIGARMRSVTDAGGVGTITAVLAWFFLWLQVTSKEEKEKQVNWMTVAGVLVAVSSVVVFLLPASKLPIVFPKNNPVVSIGADWSLAGSLLSEGVLMIFLALEWGKRLMSKLKSSADQNISGYLVEAGMASVLTLALLLDLFRIFKIGWVNLDGLSAWVIAVETFKRSPIWGVGPGNFMSAFAAFRPDSYNLTKYWTNGFKSSSMGVLQLWTELGIVGLALATMMVGMLTKLKKNFDFVIVVAMVLIVVFLPFNITGVLLLGWLVASAMEGRKMGLVFKAGENGFNVAPWFVSVLVLGTSVYGGYWLVKLAMGDMYMRQALVAASKNDGGGTYNLQIKAIGMNPDLAEYRKVYSQTNLALASTLLSNKEMSDEDKEKASVLIQQAVREAKSAITLESNNSSYWTNLAVIYRQLVGVVDGSADWSFQAYQQAVALEPSNPLSKLDMGGLLFAANRFDEADRVFEQVVTVKPDFANGWYNWAYTANKTGRIADAVSRMTQAVSLVPVDSGDYDKASKELADWKKQLDEAIKKQNAATQAAAEQQKQAETLKTEQPLPTGSKKERVAVPTGELAPPVVEITPTVTPSPAVPSGE